MAETRTKSFLGGMSRRAVASLGDTVASLPPREATLVAFPDLQPELSEALSKMGASRLYSHQLEAYERVRAGENVVVATATASGKSLCYKIPAFQNALGRAKSRAVFLYPTKALAQDQLGKIKAFDLRGVHPATYDGDTPHALRADIRRRANILLTNPDMLNIGILPNHEAWGDFLRNLEIVAVDEAHVLRGVFGSHVAAVLRRLRRVARLHGGDPQFVLTSATIANPQDLAESLTGLPFALVDNDGASTGERRVIFRNPPLLDKEKGERRRLLTEGALVFANLGSQGVRNIAFARTRKAAELIHRFAAERVGVATASRLAPYRAGYTPAQRREIERRLVDGELLGVTATDAHRVGSAAGGLASGGTVGAEKGTLTIMVGGDAAALERARGPLEAMGKKIVRVGDVGCGNVAKLVNNLISLGCNAITTEGLVLGVKGGLDPQVMWDIITTSTGDNWNLRSHANTILKDNFEPGFRLGLAYKDINLALGLGEEYDVPLPVGRSVREEMEVAMKAGHADKGVDAVILPIEKAAGVTVRLDKDD